MILLGPHETGNDIDADEREMLVQFTEHAAAAYERVITTLLQQEVAQLKSQLAALQPRDQPPPQTRNHPGVSHRITDANSHVTTFTYDAFGKSLRQTSRTTSSMATTRTTTSPADRSQRQHHYLRVRRTG